uniref:Phosphorylated adapter RNA export protein n=1 Tax=Nelumbo nucifera TaxID=4432 RepID=A0A822ZZH5_NELNU|nr:TPA_asm: hypothetical protein HUJ06_018858 [Nelumbo nucifera]
MEDRENKLESIPAEEILDNDHDVDMIDVEEGELKEQSQTIGSTEETMVQDDKMAIKQPCSRNSRRRQKRKKNKKSGSVSNVTDINRFVIDACRRLKEKKSYLVWNAVSCLGISALGDFVREASGGQMTADGKHPRTGGGILWSILKAREPEAYKEIMTRGKEFEKQFMKQGTRQVPEQKEGPSESTVCESSNESTNQTRNGVEQKDAQERRTSVLNRIRIPVPYDDLYESGPTDELT